MYGTVFSQTNVIFLFLLIYFVVNSYKVNKTLKYTGAQSPEIEIEHHRGETEGLGKGRPGVSITDTCQRSPD